jgi:hypothetical protein
MKCDFLTSLQEKLNQQGDQYKAVFVHPIDLPPLISQPIPLVVQQRRHCSGLLVTLCREGYPLGADPPPQFLYVKQRQIEII